MVKRAHTFVEIILSIVILAVVLLGIAAVFASNTKILVRNAQEVSAHTSARSGVVYTRIIEQQIHVYQSGNNIVPSISRPILSDQDSLINNSVIEIYYYNDYKYIVAYYNDQNYRPYPSVSPTLVSERKDSPNFFYIGTTTNQPYYNKYQPDTGTVIDTLWWEISSGEPLSCKFWKE